MGLSQSDVYTLALRAGLTPERARVAAAVAMAESGGNPGAHNTTPPDDSYGLWQINLYGPLRSRVQQFGLRSPDDLFDPQTNARAMARISMSGASFRPWTTYTSGAYKRYMSAPVEDQSGRGGWVDKLKALPWLIAPAIPGFTGGLVGGGVLDVVTGPAQAAVTAAEVLTRGAAWVSNPSNWVRIGYVALGGGLVLIAVNGLTNGSISRAATTTTRGAAQLAAGVATGGGTAVAGAAKKTASTSRKAAAK